MIILQENPKTPEQAQAACIEAIELYRLGCREVIDRMRKLRDNGLISTGFFYLTAHEITAGVTCDVCGLKQEGSRLTLRYTCPELYALYEDRTLRDYAQKMINDAHLEHFGTHAEWIQDSEWWQEQYGESTKSA